MGALDTIWGVAMAPVKAVGGAINELNTSMWGTSPKEQQMQKDISVMQATTPENSMARFEMVKDIANRYGIDSLKRVLQTQGPTPGAAAPAGPQIDQGYMNAAAMGQPQPAAEPPQPRWMQTVPAQGYGPSALMPQPSPTDMMKQRWQIQKDLMGPQDTLYGQQVASAYTGVPVTEGLNPFEKQPNPNERFQQGMERRKLRQTKRQNAITNQNERERIDISRLQPGTQIGSHAATLKPGSPEWRETIKTGTQSITMIPQNRPLPETAIGELNALDELKYQVQTAAENWDASYTGPVNQYLGALRQVAGVASPSEVQMRQALSSLIDLAYAKSGKQISEREMQMLTQRMPRVWNPGSTFQSRMKGFSDMLDEMARIRVENYSKFGYYVPPELLGQASPKGPTPTGPAAQQPGPAAAPTLNPQQQQIVAELSKLPNVTPEEIQAALQADAAKAAPQAARPQAGGPVRMVAPDGKLYDVDASEAQEAERNGWRRQ